MTHYVSAGETDESTKVLRIDGLLPGRTQYPLNPTPPSRQAVE